VIEEYFSMVLALMKSPMAKTMSTDLFTAIVQCGIHCLPTDQPEAAESVLDAFQEILKVVRGSSLETQLKQHGQSFVNALFQAIFYTHPPDVIRDSAYVLLDLLKVYPVDSIGWIQNVMAQVPSETLSDEEKSEWMSKLVKYVLCEEADVCSADKSVRYATEDLARAYRRRSLVKDRHA